MKQTALIIVDMQKYYLYPDADFVRYAKARYPSSLEYIYNRCYSTVIPNISRLLTVFRNQAKPVIYLKLTGTKDDRSDLHYQFREANQRAKKAGYPDLYPVQSDPMSEIVPEIAPLPGEKIFCKTTFSAFNSTNISHYLKETGISELVFTGLATSQCVDTTARDASDHDCGIIHIDDAQADYDEITHKAALYASMGVCGGRIYETEDYLQMYR